MNDLNVLFAEENAIYRRTGVEFIEDHVEEVVEATDASALKTLAGHDAVILSDKLYEKATLEDDTPVIVLSDSADKPVKRKEHVRLAKPIVQHLLLEQLDAIAEGRVVSPRTGLLIDDGEIN